MAINYTAAQLVALRRSYHIFSAAAEKRWIIPVRDAIKAQVMPVIPWIEQYGVQSALMSLQGIIGVQPVTTVIHQMYRKEGKASGLREYKHLNDKYGDEYAATFGNPQKTKSFEFFDEWLRIMDHYFDTRGADQVVRITETTRRQIQDKLIAGTAADFTFPEYRDSIIDYAADIARHRANVIARTEVISALNYAQDQAAWAAPVQFNKGWLSAHDKRTRYKPRDKGDHVILDGEEVKMNDLFSNGGKFPGDPDLPPYERIQCRCSKYHDALRDAEGRLMRK